MSLVQAPIKLTTFKCDPRRAIIFNSPTRDSMAVASAFGFTILTATVVTGSSDFNPIASAFTTRPNAPTPNSFPKIVKFSLISYSFNESEIITQHNSIPGYFPL